MGCCATKQNKENNVKPNESSKSIEKEKPKSSKKIEKEKSKSLVSIESVKEDNNKEIPKPVPIRLDDPDFLKKLEAELMELISPEIEKLFKLYDKNENNQIEIGELDQLFLKLNIQISKEGIKDIIKQFDTNKDGVLNFEEFKGIYFLEVNKLKRIAELEKKFKILDRDGNGLLSKEEIIKTYEILKFKTDDTFPQVLFDRFDADKDGYLNYNEFVKSLPGDAVFYLLR